jgi:catechol 2,3-dioxygenase-like lactoylglutathione lyase family enzyme
MSSRDYKLGMLKVPVRDVEKSVQFYEKSLGFQLEFVAKEYGWAQMKTGEISIALYQPGMGGGNREFGGSVDFHLSLDGSEFDDVAKLMKKEGNLAGDMIHKGNDGTTFIEIRDPDGNEIKVFRNG